MGCLWGPAAGERRIPTLPCACLAATCAANAAPRYLCTTTAACRPRKGSVKLVFEAADGEEVHFERVIKPTGAGAESFTSEVRLVAAP